MLLDQLDLLCLVVERQVRPLLRDLTGVIDLVERGGPVWLIQLGQDLYEDVISQSVRTGMGTMKVDVGGT